ARSLRRAHVGYAQQFLVTVNFPNHDLALVAIGSTAEAILAQEGATIARLRLPKPSRLFAHEIDHANLSVKPGPGDGLAILAVSQAAYHAGLRKLHEAFSRIGATRRPNANSVGLVRRIEGR